MRFRPWLMLCGALLLSSGCFTRAIARQAGLSGWFRADLVPSTPDQYRERFAPVSLEDPAFPCGEVTGLVRDASSPIIVLVPGIGGDGPEMVSALSTLMQSPPSSIFMFRWVLYDERDLIATRLAAGVSRLAECLPESEGRLLVLAHSAGGVVASFAMGRLRLPASRRKTPWVTLVTVASPLAGTMKRAPRADGQEELVFVLDLGTSLPSYPAAPPGVRVVHLRTSAPADPVMTPDRGFLPNDPAIGIPGARQVDLPTGLNHAGALQYVAGEVAADRWKPWRDAAPLSAVESFEPARRPAN